MGRGLNHAIPSSKLNDGLSVDEHGLVRVDLLQICTNIHVATWPVRGEGWVHLYQHCKKELLYY